MKRGVVGFVLILIFSFAFANAGSCGDNQRIMKLYSGTNAHGALWNIGSYTYDVCYDEIFGVSYDGSDPHSSCNIGDENYLLSLYSSDNSHADDGSVYTTNKVCYGDMSCEIDESLGSSCSNGGEVVVRMWSRTNAHLANSSYENYKVKVCCLPSSVYWADMNGNVVSEANVGAMVRMVAVGIDDGAFSIFEDDINFPPFSSDDVIKNNVGGENIDEKYVGTWEISKSDLALTDDYDDFKFSIGGKVSGSLKISSRVDDDEANITIVSPECGRDINEGSVVTINVSALDSDDEIKGELWIYGEGDNTGDFVGIFSNGVSSFDYEFTEGGNFRIEARSISSKGVSARGISNIMVLGMTGTNYDDGVYVAACIGSPADYSFIEGKVVEFDARGSRGLVFEGGSYTNITYSSNRMVWNWKFSDGVSFVGNSTSRDKGYDFNRTFYEAGHNSAELILEVLP